MHSVSKLLAGSAFATALLGAATGANASVTFDDIDSAALAVSGSQAFSATMVDEAGDFTHEFDFTIADAGSANSVATTIRLGGNDIDFTSIFLDTFAFTQIGFDPADETWVLSTVDLGAGLHTIQVNGSVVGASNDGAYGGVLNVAFDGGGPGAGIPEPGAWAMMILGFGASGALLRRRRHAMAATRA